MPNGYHGRILRVDLSKGTISTDTPDTNFYRQYFGGGAMATYYLLKEMAPSVDPFVVTVYARVKKAEDVAGVVIVAVILASALLAIFFGAALGNVVRGVPLDEKGEFFLPLWTNFQPGREAGILDWYTILIGVYSFVVLMQHGALWIAYKTEGAVQERARAIAQRGWYVMAALTVIVSREEPPWLPLRAALTQAVIAALATLAVWRLLRPYPWRRWTGAVLAAAQGLSLWAALACAAGALGLLALAPGVVASLGALGMLALFVAARPDAGLMLAVFLTPLAPLEKWFGPLHFSFLEIVTLLTLGVRLAWEAVAILREREGGALWQRTLQRLRAGLEALDAMDVGVVLLLGASLASLGASENLRVSLRELRVVVLQAAFLYWLATRGPMDREGLLHLADLLVLSGAVLSLYGLYQYAVTDKVIVAEGVRRIRGIFGSPNNLALVLGRLWPLMLAVALRGPTDRRRLLYGLAAVPAAACLFLTYSRAAWLFGLPAALVMLGVLAGRRARVAALAVLAAGLVALVPLAGTARLGSLFTFRGTTLLRVKLWEAAWEMARDHPVWGVGLDNFLYQYPRYIRPEALSEPNLSHPHNIVLDFWLRLGVLGFVTLGWLQWQFWRRGLALWRRRADPALWALTVGLLAGMADTLAHGAVDASFFFVELAGLFALMVAFVRRMERLQPPAPGQH
ncbi:MAG: cytochrome d ubiquinol oxidase subunit II [Anaerolineae bacterium]|nr:cytochrome d ubiquinol oxidase subunit II [Anaerolineae bacterium]